MEVRDVIWQELTPREKAKLNELCIEEMQKEILKKTLSENEMVNILFICFFRSFLLQTITINWKPIGLPTLLRKWPSIKKLLWLRSY